MKSFAEHSQLHENDRLVAKNKNLADGFTKTLEEKGWTVKFKDNGSDDVGHSFKLGLEKESHINRGYDDRGIFEMANIYLYVHFAAAWQKRASTTISYQIYDRRKKDWQTVSRVKFWEFINSVKSADEAKEIRRAYLKSAHRNGRISDEELADGLAELDEGTLLEIGDSYYPWKWTKWERKLRSDAYGDRIILSVTAETDLYDLQLKIVSGGPRILYVDFKKYSKEKARFSYMKTGEGDAFKTLSTVQNMIFEFIKEYEKRYNHPLNVDFSELQFTVEKEEEDNVDNSSRARLYKRWGETFAKKIDAKLVINKQSKNSLDYSFIFPEPDNIAR